MAQSTDKEYKQEKPAYKAIREWREDEKPRERLLKHGANTLSDAELLAILIGSGSVGFSALDAARELLNNRTMTDLASCDPSVFKKVKGLGDAKAVTLAAGFEIAKRVQAEPFSGKKTIKSPDDVAKMYIPMLRGAPREVFRCLLLNTANQIFREIIVSEGSLNASIVHPREVFKHAITESAASVILMHNHPSGNPEPSREDINITRQLAEAGKIIDIKVIDHIIIAGDNYTSLARMGLL